MFNGTLLIKLNLVILNTTTSEHYNSLNLFMLVFSMDKTIRSSQDTKEDDMIIYNTIRVVILKNTNIHNIHILLFMII